VESRVTAQWWSQSKVGKQYGEYFKQLDDFSRWKKLDNLKPYMEDLLYCKDLHGPLKEEQAKPKEISEDDWKSLYCKAVRNIR